MYNLMIKHGQLFAFGLGLLLTAITYILIISGFSEFSALPESPVDRRGETSIFNFGLMAPAVLIVLCALVAIGFGVFKMISNPKASIIPIIGIVALAVIFFIFYSSTDPASSDSIRDTLEKFNITDGRSKYISGAIWTTIVLIVLAAGSFLVSELTNLFK